MLASGFKRFCVVGLTSERVGSGVWTISRGFLKGFDDLGDDVLLTRLLQSAEEGEEEELGKESWVILRSSVSPRVQYNLDRWVEPLSAVDPEERRRPGAHDE